MDQHPLSSCEQHAIERLRIVCHELDQTATRIELAAMLANLPHEDGALTYTCPQGYIRLTKGRFDYDLRILRERPPCAQ
jgi:hypothetical protein